MLKPTLTPSGHSVVRRHFAGAVEITTQIWTRRIKISTCYWHTYKVDRLSITLKLRNEVADSTRELQLVWVKLVKTNY